MSQTPFEDLFGIETMTDSVKRFAQSQENLGFTRIWEGSAARLLPRGPAASWDEVRMTRGIAKTTGSQTPTEAVKKSKRTPKSATMLDVKEHIDLPADFLFYLRNPGEAGDNAAAAIATEMETLAIRLANAKEYMYTKACEGSLDLSAMPNSDFTHTITYPVKAQSRLNTWPTVGTKIRSVEIPALKSAFRKASGRKPGQCIAPQALEGTLVQNTEVQAFAKEVLSSSILMASDIDPNSAFSGLGGLSWSFVDNHYALDSAPDTTVDFLTAGKMIVLPKDGLRQILAIAEGRSFVPAGSIFSEASSGVASSMLKETRGFWSYAELTTNPVGIRIHAGWKGLPIIKEVDSVMNFSTT